MSAVEDAISTFEKENKPDEEILTISGHIEHKNTHHPHKSHSKVQKAYLAIWPTYLLGFLKRFLQGLAQVKQRLRKAGFKVQMDNLFINNEGQSPDRNKFARCLALAKKLIGFDWGSCFWRLWMETTTKEKQLAACLVNPSATKEQFELDCLSSHMQHSDACAEDYYRLSTKNVASTAGRVINSVLNIPKNRKAFLHL